MTSRKFVYIFLVLLVLVAAVFIFTYDFPEKIEAEYDGIQYRTDDLTSTTPIKIRMNGTLNRPLSAKEPLSENFKLIITSSPNNIG